MKIIDVPQWMQKPGKPYCGNPGPWLDEWLTDNIHQFDTGDWWYFPCNWSSVDEPCLQRRRYPEILEWFERHVPLDQPCFTFVQDARPLPYYPPNLYVFGYSYGHRLLPFVTRRLRPIGVPKMHAINFVGRVDPSTDFGGVRSKMMREAARYNKSILTTENLPCEVFDVIVESSVFTLAPRGFGPTSFRLYEAMALGSIPIYIWSEKPALPLWDICNWNKLAVVLHVDELHKLSEVIANTDTKGMARQAQGFWCLNCTYQGAADTMIELLPDTSICGSLNDPALLE